MRRSSGFLVFGIEGPAGGEERPEHVDASAREGDDGLVVSFPLLSLACVEGAAERVGEGAEGRLVEDALEAVVGLAPMLFTLRS